MASLGNRIVVLIDMDCFFCQVETRLNPEFAGKPLAVVQYNQWKSGGIIAVNYEARDFGVTRHMRGDEAKEKCPDIVLAIVPCLRGKADTSKYRSAGREVIDVIKKHCNIVERASVDEAYLDITQIIDEKLSKEPEIDKEISNQLKNTYIVGHSECGTNDEEQRSKGLENWLSELSEDLQIKRLAMAGVFIENLRKDIYETTGFRCSAGISFNKILAKLACGLHKPNRQTILPASTVPDLFGSLPIKKVRNLGGKLGDIVTDSLKCNVMADLLQYSQQHLQNRFDEKTGLWLYNIARGIDHEPVTPRLVSKSIGACKTFPGKQAIVDADKIKHWLGELAEEVCERLEQDQEENERRASLLTVSFHYYQNKNSTSQSRSFALTTYKPEKVAEQCFKIVTKATQKLPVTFLGISAGKFIKAKGSENFMNFFKVGTANDKNVSSIDIVDNAIENLKVKEETEKHNDSLNTDNYKRNNAIEKSEDKICKSSIQVKNNRRSSPCSSIKKSLKTDNFKKSFFMNILKEKKVTNESTEMVSKEDEISENICDNELDIVESKTDTTSTKSCVSNIQRDTNQLSTQLQELFPDLNDIDPSIVQLLPFHLQDEAKKFLKVTQNKQENIDTNKTKGKETNKLKGKNVKSKTLIQKQNIQNFFIKTDGDNDSENKLKKCPECDQLILINKFDEHADYHVAQNIQKEINRTSEYDEPRKRKVLLDSPKNIKKRLSDEFVNILPKTKSKS